MRLGFGAALGYRGKEQLGAKSVADEVCGNGFSRLVSSGARIEEDDNRWSSTAEGYAENARFPSQFLQTRQQRAECGAVRLMNAVCERCGEQVMAPLAESCEQEH